MTAASETAPRVLRRSSEGRVIAGVAAGFGRHLNVDPALVRVALVVLALVPPGIGLLAYLVSWIVIPADAPAEQGEGDAGPRRAAPVAAATAARGFGALLVALGALLAIEIAEPSWIDFDGRYVAVAVLVLLGIGLLARGARD